MYTTLDSYFAAMIQRAWRKLFIFKKVSIRALRNPTHERRTVESHAADSRYNLKPEGLRIADDGVQGFESGDYTKTDRSGSEEENDET